MLAERLARQPELRGEAFNFSTESQITVSELVNKILSVMKSDLQPEIRKEANKEIREQYLTAVKARNVLGWSPQFDLDTGLQRTVDWYRKFLSNGQ